ncbi:FKBP-type peptidyl-prolyl cis-trans isomerase [Rhizosphaericola mali]|uniref:Peptidyl-prolyl cis-trans isomerase n=1 Tax=Rhizosphaericola mali TaxID=2545455 RepID=A0A5P2G761_9BACT|nr:FKBP-type peptidyl-prolyl cis-trans isomerase [Rhizosphaericola mali]QES89063.1 hypothetical protein E0W69_010475 [Rhizosphaericola mali]
MRFKKLLAFSTLITSIGWYSCVKDNNDNTTNTTYQDPSLEKNAIDSFITAKGLNMSSDPNYSGLRFQVLDYGDTTANRISATTPYATLTYRGTLLNDTAFATTLQSNGADSVNMAILVQYNSNLYFNTVVGFGAPLMRIGMGGHIKIVTPSAYAYGSAAQYDANGKLVIPANSPLYFDIYLKRATSN